MVQRERAISILIGLNILITGVCGLSEMLMENSVSIPRVGISSISLLAGFLMMFRNHAIASYALFSKPYWLLAIICNVMIFKFSTSTITWPIIAKCIFLAGALITFISLLHLGKSFCIIPSLRGLVKKGMYRIIRHPTYFGELLMSLACIMTNPTISLVVLFLTLLYLQVSRIREEEKLLSQSSAYLEYSKEVRWKFIPFVW